MNETVKHAPLSDDPEALNFGPYRCFADASLRLISVFYDLRYNPADVGMLSPAMRGQAITRLTPFGFKQISGTILLHEASGARCFIPKFHALGTPPFDITRYTPRGADDFYILTPTQTTC